MHDGRRTLLLFLAAAAAAVVAYEVDPGPSVPQTKGAVWPRPQHQETLGGYFVVRPSLFSFSVIGNNCEVLQNAIDRYWAIILKGDNLLKNSNFIVEARASDFRQGKTTRDEDDEFKGYLDTLEVYLDGVCDDSMPSLNMDEEYFLNVSSTENKYAILSSKSMWGALRGLETFTQLVHLADDQMTYVINATNIHDFPRFAHRGLLLDTSRHFLPVSTILQTLDAMSYNKMNVFHWHITDDQSFPYRSAKFPSLSEQGAYHPLLAVYSSTDIKTILEYAKFRGIRVIPEFDTPAHTRSWGVAMPKLLTPCYNDNGELNGKLGPMNPIDHYTYSFMQQFLSEVVQVFPDPYVHVGADEVDYECWKSNPDIIKYMESHNMTDRFGDLEGEFVNEVLSMVQNLNATPIVWEDVLEHDIELRNGTIVQVWKGDYINVLSKVVSSGHYGLLSSCWYLDHLDKTWLDFYRCEPTDIDVPDEDKLLIMGGEACMWSEMVNSYMVVSRIWPRASATAEVLWSSRNGSDTEPTFMDERRMEEQACRMNSRGIPAQPPTGPGFCL